jgi:hypothetical protein
MKWFTATNEASLRDPAFFELLQVAVCSLKKHTSLDPHLLYEGEDCEALDWLRTEGVTIVPVRLSFYHALRTYMLPDYQEFHIACRAGAFLRTEMTPAIRAYGIEDEYVFYTDCDVVFMSDIVLDACRPKFFAAVGTKVGGRTRLRLGGHYHINSGVMLVNVDGMKSCYEEFKAFVLGNGLGIRRPADPFMQKNLFMSDQVALNLYYKGRIDALPKEYNWNPTAGINERAKIVHFNGLKWNQWEAYQSGTLDPVLREKYKRGLERDPAAYAHYSTLARSIWTNGMRETT